MMSFFSKRQDLDFGKLMSMSNEERPSAFGKGWGIFGATLRPGNDWYEMKPRKQTWNPQIGGVGRCFSFSKGVFSGSSHLFLGVYVLFG